MSGRDSAEYAIATQNLTKEYGDVTALDGINLQVDHGEIFGFLGPNGAGKTTTIDILLDFIRPTAGSASVLGHDTRRETDQIRKRVGILPDGFDLWKRTNGYKHLEFALESKDGTESPDALLDRVGLSAEDAKRPVGQYSKGMLQRLGMAMALVGDPELLILDEPSSGLDPHGIQRMQQLVREEARRGTTIFFSSHILGQVSAVCDRVGILDSGNLVRVDTIDGLREAAGVGSKLVFQVDSSPQADLSTIDGVTDVTQTDGSLVVSYSTNRAKAKIVHAVVEANVLIKDFEIQEATLDELFTAYTDTQENTVQGNRHATETTTEKNARRGDIQSASPQEESR